MIKVIFCDLDVNRCKCKEEWDDSDHRDTCANQKGCTECDGSGYTWCHPTNNECDTVERNGNGDSQGRFRCKGKTINHLAQTAFERIFVLSIIIVIINETILIFSLPMQEWWSMYCWCGFGRKWPRRL